MSNTHHSSPIRAILSSAERAETSEANRQSAKDRCPTTQTPGATFEETATLQSERTDLQDLFANKHLERRWLPRDFKLASEKIAVGFECLGSDYAVRSTRMRQCGQLLEFVCYRINEGEDLLRRVTKCSWCRIRLCFLCERQRSRKRHIQLTQMLAGWLAESPTDQSLLLTLTVPSITDAELPAAINDLILSCRRLTRAAPFKRGVKVWYRSVEISRDPFTGLWHPHAHFLLIVPASYFRRTAGIYIDQRQGEWTAIWRKAAKLHLDPIVDIRALAGVGGGPLDEIGRKSLAEVTKYCTKPGDLVQFGDLGEPLPVDPQVLKTLFDALYGRRLVGMSRALRKLSRKFGHDDTEAESGDLSIADKIPDGAVFLGREIYHWHPDARDYVRGAHPKWPQGTETTMPP
jgi:plasmid rolling circle replication initiator protein Rep